MYQKNNLPFKTFIVVDYQTQFQNIKYGEANYLMFICMNQEAIKKSSYTTSHNVLSKYKFIDQ